MTSTEALVQALTQINAPQEMIAKAREDYYNEMKSALATPLIQLALDARDAGLGQEFHQRIIDGEFDATNQEIEEWAESPDGQDTIRRFMEGS